MERPSFLSRVLSTALLSGFAGLLLLQPLTGFAAGDSPSIKDKAGVPGFPAVSITENLPERINAVYENIRWELLGAGTMAFMNAMQTFFGQIAYDAADYIASGGKGQSALYYEKGFEGYIKDVAGSAAGEFIGSLSQASFFQTIGFDLCRPPDPRTLLQIQLSLGNFLGQGQGVNQAFQRPQARCDFNDIIRNYEQVYQTLSNEQILNSVEANINTNSNDLGVSFMIFNRAASFVYSRQENAEKDRKEGDGYQALRDMISGRVRTPSDTIREEANQVLVKDPKANQQQINGFIAQQAFNLGPQRLAVYTASVFLNTLTSKMLKRVFEEGIDIGGLFKLRSLNVSSNPDELLDRNREDIRKANISLRTPNLFRDQAYDVLAEMQACPENRGIWNCVVDEGLAQALRSEGGAGVFTIREALELGYLHGDWRLFPSSNIREEQDALCYTYGYCAGNMRKLRLMRVLPVGFEFAANDPQNIARCGSERGCVTLQEVVDGFTVCNEQGERDESHPWCKMIDPNWGLADQPKQCALSGFGETMLSGNLPQRREECQDIQTCLQRNDRGECIGGYGYCVAEKTAYRFGAQECSARFASCRTYESRAGEQVSYLRNALDYTACSEDSVGCMWYATTRDPANGSDTWVGTPSNGPRVYFDKTMEACQADQAGCTSLLAVPPETSALNLVANASFERMVEGSSRLQNWMPLVGTDVGYVRPTVEVGPQAVDGTNVAHFAAGFAGGYRQVVDVAPGRSMVLSAFVRQWRTVATNEKLTVGILQYPSREAAELRAGALTGNVTARDYRSRECTVSPAGAIGPNSESVYGSTDWVRVECAFTTNQSARAAEIIVEGDNMLADGIMLEEGMVATAYLDGVNGQLAQVYHKVAPDEFACTGDNSDHPSCANYARVCKQTEANCDGYTDLSSDLPEVTAQLSRGDLCPGACVGYAEYRKLASSFDLVQSTEDALNDRTEPAAEYFIPSTAEQCSQEAVGCEEFTIVDGTDQGGETTAAFSSLRFCELPSADTDTFFTWEGSDSAGYQLRTWALKKRTTEKPGMVPPEGATIGTSAGPRIIVKPAGDMFSQKDPAGCNEESWRTGGDGDCRQFYNAGGSIFYRYYSQTVLSTNDCRQFRLAATNEQDCTKTGGTHNATANTCTYMAHAPESRSCQASFAGCRAYAGAESGNTRTIFTANGQSTSAPVRGTTSSNESLVVGDASHRYDIQANGAASPSITFPSSVNGLYRVSFWVKSTAPAAMNVIAVQPSEGDDAAVGTTSVTGEWKRVSFGLFSGMVGDETRLEFRTTVGSSAAAVFIDEITVQQMRDVVYVRRGTWNTPAQCDQTAYGVPEPQAMLGCRQYQNRSGQSVAAKQFSQLCRPAAVGCREFIDTRNSAEPYRAVTTLADVSGPSSTVAPADRFIYLVDDPTKRCDADGVMCKAFGKPVFSNDRQSIDRFETVYLKDDVRAYSEGLCKPSELFCEEFATTGGREFFKDPQNHLCEYRERVNVTAFAGVADGTYSGWFVKGESTPCYPDALASGQEFLLLKSGDRSPGAGYQGWGGSCPVEASECTEFRDPNDRSGGAASSGRAYYFIKDDRIDQRSCNGTVDPSRGCVLVRDMSTSALTYNLDATQRQYEVNGLRPTTPVNCEEDPTQAGCPRGRCVGTRVTTNRSTVGGLVGTSRQDVTETESRAAYTGGQCSTTSDCTMAAAPTRSTQAVSYLTADGAATLPAQETRVDGVNCEVSLPGGGRSTVNDANMVVKVKMDRDCAQWLGCSSGETIFDPATNRYREVCTQVALCDKAQSQGGPTSYCANYVNRATTSTEPVLVAGGYFDAETYTSRPTGVNSRDYSGYAIPNAFQIPDTKSSQVVSHVSALYPERSVPDAQSRRFTVVLPLPPLVRGSGGSFVQRIAPTRPNQAELLPANDPARAGFTINNGANVDLCRHRGTGQIGYYLRAEADRGTANCYFGFRGGVEANNFRQLADQLSVLETQEQSTTVDGAYPRALCRAYPEADAPFGTVIVQEWDQLLNPPAPKQREPGYESVNVCAFGEDCSCSYKRVTYPGRPSPLFFSAQSQAVPPGLCVGGPRDGQSCVPSVVFDPSGSTSTAAQAAAAANLGCGPAAGGGRCVAFDKIEKVRGVEGVCLEYDTSRPKGILGDQQYPCLTWSPTPIIGGTNDPYRYVDTAGYFPPQNSGQYYCASPAKNPTSVDIRPEYFDRLPDGMMLPGENGEYPKGGLAFHDNLVSDAHEFGSSGNRAGSYFNRASPGGSLAANQCEEADDDQDNGVMTLINNLGVDERAIRLVATGRRPEESYTETFYGISAGRMQEIGIPSENNLSFFEIKPFENPNGNGRLACGYNEDWVDGVRVSDYDNSSETATADRQWRQGFFAEQDLQTILTRGSEKVLTREPNGENALRMPCYNSPDRNCVVKYWEGGYRAADKSQKFLAFTSQGSGISSIAQLHMPEKDTCTSDKPYYAIRAVFESDQTPTDQNAPVPVNGVRGPWKFIGFWVSACGGRASTDNHFMYMYVRAMSADVCRELVEVRSVETAQDAAFTDRVWRESKYTVPNLNIGYGQTFAPFSSALNTGPAGSEPLFQVPGLMAGVSAAKTGSFLASGYSTYSDGGGLGTPAQKYAYLSNLFARIYRVYRFTDQTITVDDRTCVAGTFEGKKCTPQSPTDRSGPSADCGLPTQETTAQQCQTTVLPTDRTVVCMESTGINAGTIHTVAPGTLGKPLAQLCIGAPDLFSTTGQKLFGDCVAQAGWRRGANQLYLGPGDTGENGTFTQRQAAVAGAFRCSDGSIPITRSQRVEGDPDIGRPLYCTGEATNTYECPIRVTGQCVGASPTTLGQCKNIRWTENGQQRTVENTQIDCLSDLHCSYTEDHFWKTNFTGNASADRWTMEEQTVDPNDPNRRVPHVDGRLGFVRINNPIIRLPSCRFAEGCDLSTGIQDPDRGYDYFWWHYLGTRLASTDLTPVTGLFPGPGSTWPSRLSMSTRDLIQVYTGGAAQYIAPVGNVTGNPLASVSVGICSSEAASAGRTCVVDRAGAGSLWATQWNSCARSSSGRTADPRDYLCEPVSNASGHPAERCRLPNNRGINQTRAEYYEGLVGQESIPPADRNENNDNNTCTMVAGYQPNPRLCPDPNSEFCGLIAYDMRPQPDSQTFTTTLLPTDVTLGHYTPSYLGSNQPDANFRYIHYYTPRPPRIAAPPVSCPSGMSCGVQDLDRFSFNGVTEGVLNVVGGQQRSTIKFYGWAAHEQMAIRKLSVDWGDGMVEHFDDVRMKNRKPFCSVQKECYASGTGFTGLTCQTDSDCPLTAQACRPMGSCKDKPNIVCTQNSDCRRDGTQDVCQMRSFFGNSAEACQASPFEFSHAYACAPNAADTLPDCTGQNFVNPDPALANMVVPAGVRAPAGGQPGTCFYGNDDSLVLSLLDEQRPTCQNTQACTDAAARVGATGLTAITCGPPSLNMQPVLPPTPARCSGDATRHCAVDGDCAAGDRCIAGGIAPPGGCWDRVANACRFTPRVFLQDNWGWCTGECRTTIQGGELVDSTTSRIRHPYGGCYTPVPVGGDPRKESVRPNTQELTLDNPSAQIAFESGLPRALPTGIECSVENPLGGLSRNGVGRVVSSDPRRSQRPWITFPGSLQLRPR